MSTIIGTLAALHVVAAELVMGYLLFNMYHLSAVNIERGLLDAATLGVIGAAFGVLAIFTTIKRSR